MIVNEAEFDRIEAYLEGALPDDERRQMDEEMTHNSDLQRAVEEHRVIWEGLQVPVAVDYFQEIHSQLEEQGWLQYDDIWVEAEPAGHPGTEPPEQHTGHDDEPEVFVADDPANRHDLTAHAVDVSVTDEPPTEHLPDPNDTSHEWDSSIEPEPPHAHMDDSDDYL